MRDFCNEVRDLGEYMVNAAVDIYERIARDLLPTPAKSHYVFNLRDLSKCIQGITQADSGTLREESAMLRLFYHECLRVFHDRLINIEDKSYFYFLMKEICQRNFGTSVLELPDVPVLANPPVLLFGDFLQVGVDRENRLYEELKNVEKLKSVLEVRYSQSKFLRNTTWMFVLGLPRRLQFTFLQRDETYFIYDGY